MHRDPSCKCEVTFYKKKRKGVLPCIVGIMRDSATQKPVLSAGVVINKIVLRTDKDGHTYCEVIPGKHTLIAKAFTYYFCTQKVVAQEGDSIVCVFDMRRNREPSDNAADFMHPSFFQRVRALIKR
jgi:hypothetical protein